MKGAIETALVAGLAAMTLAGCGPAYVGMRVGPPPPPAYGVVGVAPGPGYVWTDGFYDLRGGRWVWVGGRWMLPPRPHAVWVPGRWSPRGGHYYWHRGYWR